jgi:hypothetical protein
MNKLIMSNLRQSQIAALRQLRTKQDIKLLDFDQSQIMMYQKIRAVKSNLDNLPEPPRISSAVRKLKLVQLKNERFRRIENDNFRLYRNMVKISQSTDRQN